MNLKNYKEEFEEFLLQQIPDKNPEKLYLPIKYILHNGGKRIRALMVILSAESFGQSKKESFPAAAAIEIFHNFTLLHDDIMDHADIRRGHPTVHKKWDENTAILSGDTMLILAYKMLEKYEAGKYKKLNTLLNKTAIEVCEGQQMDMDFETANDVSAEDYLEMIRLKTAILLGAALQFGGIISNAKEEDLINIYRFGENLGIAFQIQDDYLDSFGDEKNFGKKIGGDILDRKKTILYIDSLKHLDDKDKEKLKSLFASNRKDKGYINEVLQLYNKSGAPARIKKLAENYTYKSLENLQNTNIPTKYKSFWKQFALELMGRSN